MPSDPSEIAHLLRRSGFAALPAEIDALTGLEWNAAVEAVLDTSAAVDPNQGVPNLSEDRGYYERYVDMIWFWLERARTSPAPIVEKMVLFWHGHFCSSLEKTGNHQAMFDQNQLFRTNGLGDFADLTRRVSLQPAMISYLDNDRNVIGSPNENFARELMELFTMGVGNYSEDDIRESARAWTGHGLDDNDHYRFSAEDHDFSSKSFLGRSGPLDGPDIINTIMTDRRGAVARLIATKLWSFLAYPEPEEAVVSSLVASFQPTLNIKELLRAIFQHPQFRSTKAKTGLIRSPIEYAVAAMRHTGLSCSQANPQWSLREMGQDPFRPPNVAGWKQNEYWISSSSVWAKSGFASGVRWTQFNAGVFTDIAQLEVEQSVDAALARYGITSPAPTTSAALEQFVLAERATSRWAERAGLLMLPLLSPDFQLA